MNTDLQRKRQSVIDVGQRNTLEAATAMLRHNKEVLTSLRRENKELRQALQQSLRGQQNITPEDHYRKEKELLHIRLCVLKRSLNEVKGRNEKLSDDIAQTVEETSFVQREGDVAIDESSSIAQKTRALENRLDKCLIKHNEANSICRTYETIMERLSKERLTFDTQTEAMEKIFKIKQQELQELKTVASEAAKERDKAKEGVIRLKSKFAEDRKLHKKDIEERMAFVQQKKELLERQAAKLRAKLAQDDEVLRSRRLQQMESGGGSGMHPQGGTHSRGKNGPAGTATGAGTLPPIGGGAASGTAHSATAMMSAAELAAYEENAKKQRDWYVKLRETAKASTVHDVIQSFLHQVEVTQQLQDTSQELKKDIEMLSVEKRELDRQYEEVLNGKARTAAVVAAILAARAAGSGASGYANFSAASAKASAQVAGTLGAKGMLLDVLDAAGDGSARVVEEYERYLAELQVELEKANAEFEDLNQLIVTAQSGVHYIAGNLSIQVNTSNNSLSGRQADEDLAATADHNQSANAAGDLLNAQEEQNLTSLLQQCEEKILLMMRDVSKSELEAARRDLCRNQIIVPENNCRVQTRVLRFAQQRDATVAAVGADLDDDLDDLTDPDDSCSRREGDGLGLGGEGATKSTNMYGKVPTADELDGEIYSRKDLKAMSLGTVQREEKKAKRLRESKKETM